MFSGTVTVDGAAWPSGGISGSDSGSSLVFVRTDNRNEFPVGIGTGTVSRKLLQGTYDILFRGNYSTALGVARQDVILLSHCRIP